MKTVWLWIKTTVYAIFNILIVGCPFIVYPNVWKKLQEPELTPWTIIMLLFIIGALTFNAVFAMKRLLDLDKGKPKADEFDVQLVVDDKKNLKYIKIYKNGKIFEVKDVNEIPVNNKGEANAKES